MTGARSALAQREGSSGVSSAARGGRHGPWGCGPALPREVARAPGEAHGRLLVLLTPVRAQHMAV